MPMLNATLGKSRLINFATISLHLGEFIHFRVVYGLGIKLTLVRDLLLLLYLPYDRVDCPHARLPLRCQCLVQF